MNFDYFHTTVVQATLDIEDIGNVTIKAFNDLGEGFVLIINTTLGSTRVFQYGPYVSDLSLLPKTVTCTFKRIEFSQSKIVKIIKDFLNNPYTHITQAFVTTRAEALEDCKSLIDYMKQDTLY